MKGTAQKSSTLVLTWVQINEILHALDVCRQDTTNPENKAKITRVERAILKQLDPLGTP